MGLFSSVVNGFAKGVGGLLSGSFGNMIQGGVSSALDYKTSVKLMEKQFDLQKDLNKYNALNRYPWAVKSLRDANLNPILAATQGQPLAGGSPQYNDVSPATRAIHSAKALQEIEATQAGIDKTKADTDASRALANQYSSSAIQADANTRLIMQQVERLARENKILRDNPAYAHGQVTRGMLPFNSGGLIGMFAQLFGGK